MDFKMFFKTFTHAFADLSEFSMTSISVRCKILVIFNSGVFKGNGYFCKEGN